MKLFDIDYSDDVKMWELVKHDEKSGGQTNRTGVCAKQKEVATALAGVFERNVERLKNIYHKLYETDIDETILIDLLNIIVELKGIKQEQ